MVDSNYESYNFQGKLISNISDSLFELEQKIANAYQERPKYFIEALSELKVFISKIIGMELKYDKKTISLVEAYLKYAQLQYNNNNLLEGSEYLSKSYEKICNIIKFNNMMFPKTRKVTSFKKWTEQQI